MPFCESGACTAAIMENPGEQSLSDLGAPISHNTEHTGGTQRVSSVDTQEGEGIHTGWGDHDENELPDYNEHIYIYWEPDPDSGGSDYETLKLSSTTC